MKPITRLIIATITAFLICQILFMICDKSLTRFTNHKTERISEIFLNKTAFDMVFIGSSRTHTSINPFIIDSICGVNSYNAGVDGGNLYEFKLTFDGYLVNHPHPKYLILTLDLLSFDLRKRFFNYTQYFPYTKNHVIKEKLKENGYYPILFQLLPFLKLTIYDDYTRGNIVKGLMGATEIPPGDFQYKGFLTNTDNYISEIQQASVTPTLTADISNEAKGILQSIIEVCKSKNIKLVFTYAPEYRHIFQNHYLNKEEVFNTINDIARIGKITFMRHDHLDMCQDNKLFAKVGHVNKPGADVYSRILAEQLKTLIK